MKRVFSLLAISLCLFSSACKSADKLPSNSDNTILMSNSTTNVDSLNNLKAEDTLIKIATSEGDITVRLFGDTPIHTNNFIKLAKEGYYDGVLFHRVINDFMIQTGDPNSKNAPKGKMLGDGEPGYTLPAEFVYPKHYHKYGALAAARLGDNENPEKRSSGSQFYIVTGRKFNAGQLDQMEKRMDMAQQQEIFNRLASENRDSIMALRRNRDQAGLQQLQEQLVALTQAEAAKHPYKYTEQQRQDYINVGGTPHLDGSYTVFGEVVTGMEVVDKIQKAETDGNDRPLNDIKILSMTVLDK